MMYRTHFSVQGEGHFPIDMLRYDAAHPLTEQDSYRVYSTFPPHREKPSAPVRLEKFHPDKDPHLTDARWRSFRWTIVEGSVQTEKR